MVMQHKNCQLTVCQYNLGSAATILALQFSINTVLAYLDAEQRAIYCIISIQKRVIASCWLQLATHG